MNDLDSDSRASTTGSLGGFNQAALFDPARLEALNTLRLLDTAPEEPFDRLTMLAAHIFKTPIALVSLVDDHRQFFKSSIGLAEPLLSCRETPLTSSFCQHVVTSQQPLVVTDARVHPLVCDNPAVSELGVIAYLGAPLRTPEGEVVGSFCVIDNQPREWTPGDIDIMRSLAASVMTEATLRTRTRSSSRSWAIRSVASVITDAANDRMMSMSPGVHSRGCLSITQKLPTTSPSGVRNGAPR